MLGPLRLAPFDKLKASENRQILVETSTQIPTPSVSPAKLRERGSSSDLPRPLIGTSSEKKSSQFQKSQTLPSSEKNPEKHKEAAIKKEVECDDEIILIDSDLSGNNFLIPSPIIMSNFLVLMQNNVLSMYGI